MVHLFVLFCLWHMTGVFGDSVKVMEGVSVTLKTDLTKIHEEDDILWKFGAEKSLIAKISRAAGIFSTYDDVLDGRFRDRLKLDDQTGSLTITNITTEHAGVYQLEIKGVKLTSKTFSVSVYELYGHCDSAEAVLRLVVTALMGVAAAAAAVLLVNDVRATRA